MYTIADKMLADNVVELCGSDDEAVALAVKCLENGEIIALPTDTIYGLAVDASNSTAIASLYEVKGRDNKKPFAICVKSVSEVKKWGVTDDLPKGLLTDLLPGPVTLLLNRKHVLNPDLNPGVTKVGIRVPGITLHPFISYVSAVFKNPLALTSANLSNEPSSVSVEEFKVLWPKLGAVFYDGNGKGSNHQTREGSTIVDLSEKGYFKVTRPGIAYNQTLKTLQKYGLKPFT